MRVKRKSCAPRVVARRIISMLAVSLLTALFAVAGPLTKTSFAESAIWNGNTLTYESEQYEREQPNPLPASDTRDQEGKVAYTWIETLSSGDQKAHTLYFENENQASQLRDQDTATLITYDFSPPDNYSNPSQPENVDVTVDLTGDQADDSADGAGGSRCSGGAFKSLGWILCSVSDTLSTAVDSFYGIVVQFLEVPSLLSSGDESGIYELWKVMRTISNVVFVIAFIVIIYSQITSIGISSYNIRAMLPRLVIAAILVNMSFWICSLAIDASNLIGHSIQSVLMNIRDNITIENADQVSWGSITNWILAGGGTALAIGTFTLTPTVSGALPALGFLILSALISAAFALFVAFVILAARQAIITVLVIISPLAFVAYILPNTEEYFTKWRKSLMTLLVFFPIFSLIFGGSQLAGLAIIQRGMQLETGQIQIVILGLAVQVVPLVITPLLIKFSSGLLGTIANMTNSSKHGPLDRMKNWANSNAEYYAGKKRASVAQKMSDPNRSGWKKWGTRIGNPGYLGMKADQRNRKMESAKSDNEKYLSDRAEEERLRLLEKSDGTKNKPWNAAERSRVRHRERMSSAVDLSETSGRFKSSIEGRGKEMAAARLDATDKQGRFDLALHESQRKATATSQSTDVMSGRFEAIVQEWKAGENGYTSEVYDKLSDELKDELRSKDANKTSKNIGKLTFEIAQQEKRKSSADVVIKENEAKQLKNDITKKKKADLAYAGGIDELGRYKVMGRANSEAGALHMENVKAYDSVLSNEAYSVQEMLDIQSKGKMRDGSKASELQVHAAMQRIVTKVGNNWSAQKVADKVAEQGMQIGDDGLYRDNENNIIGTGAVNDAEVTRRRELQQILRDSIQNSKLQIKYLSNTEQSNMERGLFMSGKNKDGSNRTRSEELIAYDTRMGKYDAERIATADPDELARMVQVFRDPKARKDVGKESMQNIVRAIEEAQSNPNLRGRIKDRERGIMNVLASYLDKNEPEDRSELSRENYYYIATEDKNDPMYNVRVPGTYSGAIRKQVEVRVPNKYKATRQNDYKSGAGKHDKDLSPTEQKKWQDDWRLPDE